MDLHNKSLVIDMHNDTMMKLIDDETWLPHVDLADESKNHIDINKMKEGNLSVGFFAAYSEPYFGIPERSLSMTLSLINAMYASERSNPHALKITSTLKEIEDAVADHKIAMVPTIEGAYSFTEDNAIELLNQFHDLKVKAIGFTWNYSNQVAEGLSKVYGDKEATPSPAGLTDLGRDLISHMNKLGMIIDVSHQSVDSFFDVIKHSRAPIIASHTGAYSVKAHERNLNDEQLLALKENGGLIGVVLFPEFIGDRDKTYIKDYVDHIDYIVNLIGIDHVAMGSDFDGAEMPLDLKDVSEIHKITSELEDRGYSEEDIEKFLGKNVLRLIKEVEDCAESREESSIGLMPAIDKGISAIIDNLSLVDKNTIRVIINGIEVNFLFNEKEGIIRLDDSSLVKEKFQVITFEVKDKKGLIKRSTIMIYL